MGRMLISLLAEHKSLQLSAALEHAASPHLGSDAGLLAGVKASGILISADAPAALAASDVLIDFTVPESTLAHLALCRASGTRIVIGTTGFGDAVANIQAAAEHVPVMFAPNMSVGVNLCFKLLDLTARVLGATRRRAGRKAAAPARESACSP